MNINKFLEKGNNKLIAKIVIGVIVIILSLFSLYFAVNLISANTAKNYLKTVADNGLGILIFGGADFLIIAFTKPLFGFTSVIDNYKARKVVKRREKESKKFIEEQAKETLRRAREARKAEKAKNA